ncbi:MAG TPA: TIGR03621 family F420-dependent LLM class oxidoreductase [Ktedonobacteraceae bacterium]|nr:TIGR03621 family F420-dependent LLM class oxidoreductase [Ktedonobacteraceae bacterium]
MKSQRAFRFGVIDESSLSRKEWVQKAQRVEQLGYSTFLIRDHFIQGDFNHQLAPVPALMAAADVTKTLRVGSLVFDNDYRHPVMLAKEAATLDVLSDGRFELGIGAGWLASEYEQTGMPFDQPGIRVERLHEALHVLKGIFAEEPFTFTGQHYTITNLDSHPKPVQKPHPPLLIGAGSKRMLSIAAREADIIGILPKALTKGTISEDPTERLSETIAQKVAWIRQAAGERFDEIELSMVVTLEITHDQEQTAAQIIQQRGWSDITSKQVLEMPSMLIGSPDQLIEKLQAVREKYGFSYFVISDTCLETFASIVMQLAGK